MKIGGKGVISMKVDLNCDLGESFGSYTIGNDEGLLDIVTSANIACGFHAGDPTIMRKTVQLAMEKSIGIGAHPGYPDLGGFGRRAMALSSEEVYDAVVYQVGALYGFVRAQGGKMQHVKPHGALYNTAAKDKVIAEAIAKAVYDVDHDLILYGLSGSELIKAGKKIGLRIANEAFGDRTYQKDGTLTSRRFSNALIKNKETAVDQVLKMVKEGAVKTIQGQEIAINVDSVCLHGDGRHALEFARNIRDALQKDGIEVSALK